MFILQTCPARDHSVLSVLFFSPVHWSFHLTLMDVVAGRLDCQTVTLKDPGSSPPAAASFTPGGKCVTCHDFTNSREGTLWKVNQSAWYSVDYTTDTLRIWWTKCLEMSLNLLSWLQASLRPWSWRRRPVRSCWRRSQHSTESGPTSQSSTTSYVPLHAHDTGSFSVEKSQIEF